MLCDACLPRPMTSIRCAINVLPGLRRVRMESLVISSSTCRARLNLELDQLSVSSIVEYKLTPILLCVTIAGQTVRSKQQ